MKSYRLAYTMLVAMGGGGHNFVPNFCNKNVRRTEKFPYRKNIIRILIKSKKER